MQQVLEYHRIPFTRAVSTTCPSELPPGARNRNGVTPRSFSMAFVVVISISIRCGLSDANGGCVGWLHEWFPMVMPALISSRTMSGYRCTRYPTTKNVA